MSDLIWLSDAQMHRIERHFPRSRGALTGAASTPRYDRCAHTFKSAIRIAARHNLLALINES
jgi:hypothetical protein